MRNRKILIYLLMILLLLEGCLVFFVFHLNKKEPVMQREADSEKAAPEIIITGNSKEDTQSKEDAEGESPRPWETQVEPIRAFSGDLPRIICWGDSLTESVDGRTAYPDVLAQLTETEVVNYGVRSETTRTIAMREGAVPVYTGEFVIPEDTSLTPLQITNSTQFLKNGTAGVNPCYIGGVAGTLSYDGTAGTYYFSRLSAGESVYVEAGSRITTNGMADKQKEDVLIIFTGTNDAPDPSSIYDIITIQKAMLAYTGCENYLIIGLTCKKVMPKIEELNEILAEEYGEHFLDIRSYLLTYGLEEAGIEASAQDLADLEDGEIPSSLRRDYVHGNEVFYQILAGQIYRKLQYLGYLPLE